VEVVEMMISQTVRRNDPQVTDSVRQTIRSMKPESEGYYLALLDVQTARRGSNWEKYPSAVFAMLEEKPLVDNRTLNIHAWDFYQHIEDQQALKKMTSIVAAAIKKEDGYALHDTYASLLFKTKNYRQALREARVAIELARKEDTSYDETLELIAEIEKAMKGK